MHEMLVKISLIEQGTGSPEAGVNARPQEKTELFDYVKVSLTSAPRYLFMLLLLLVAVVPRFTFVNEAKKRLFLLNWFGQAAAIICPNHLRQTEAWTNSFLN
jgi:hypothetical protein